MDEFLLPSTQMDEFPLEDAAETKIEASATQNQTSDSNGAINTWGILRRHGNDGVEIELEYRVKDGRKDTYSLGRSRNCDVPVPDRRVSSMHCAIYCDYSQPRMRVFVEDCSANGTFVNDALTKLSKGGRLELRSGDEIYLVNPRNIDPYELHTHPCVFTFINMRDRIFANREIGLAPTASSAASSNHTQIEFAGSEQATLQPHVEDVYIIGDQIGAGMSGEVHLCIHRKSGRRCAVKIIDTRKFALTPGLAKEDLLMEATLMQELKHPYIIEVLDTFHSPTAIYIVMELVEGGDLFDRIVERIRYPEENARIVMTQILTAVQYLHSQHVVHRDLKPENILLVEAKDDTKVKVTDFGLAKRVSAEGLRTFCGTPQYFAPEVLLRRNMSTRSGNPSNKTNASNDAASNSNNRYGMAADMWSIGVILYIMLSGTFPFDEDNLYDQIERAQYNFSGNEWAHISLAAQHLIRSLLTVRTDLRLTAQEALQHPWITKSPFPPPPPISSVAATAQTSTSSSKDALSLFATVTQTATARRQKSTTRQISQQQRRSSISRKTSTAASSSAAAAIEHADLEQPPSSQSLSRTHSQSSGLLKRSSFSRLSFVSKEYTAPSSQPQQNNANQLPEDSKVAIAADNFIDSISMKPSAENALFPESSDAVAAPDHTVLQPQPQQLVSGGKGFQVSTPTTVTGPVYTPAGHTTTSAASTRQPTGTTANASATKPLHHLIPRSKSTSSVIPSSSTKTAMKPSQQETTVATLPDESALAMTTVAGAEVRFRVSKHLAGGEDVRTIVENAVWQAEGGEGDEIAMFSSEDEAIDDEEEGDKDGDVSSKKYRHNMRRLSSVNVALGTKEKLAGKKTRRQSVSKPPLRASSLSSENTAVKQQQPPKRMKSILKSSATTSAHDHHLLDSFYAPASESLSQDLLADNHLTPHGSAALNISTIIATSAPQIAGSSSPVKEASPSQSANANSALSMTPSQQSAESCCPSSSSQLNSQQRRKRKVNFADENSNSNSNSKSLPHTPQAVFSLHSSGSALNLSPQGDSVAAGADSDIARFSTPRAHSAATILTLRSPEQPPTLRDSPLLKSPVGISSTRPILTDMNDAKSAVSSSGTKASSQALALQAQPSKKQRSLRQIWGNLATECSDVKQGEGEGKLADIQSPVKSSSDLTEVSPPRGHEKKIVFASPVRTSPAKRKCASPHNAVSKKARTDEASAGKGKASATSNSNRKLRTPMTSLSALFTTQRLQPTTQTRPLLPEDQNL